MPSDRAERSRRDCSLVYDLIQWKTHIISLLESEDMIGFADGEYHMTSQTVIKDGKNNVTNQSNLSILYRRNQTVRLRQRS